MAEATTPIQIPFPESGDPRLRISVGPAKLRLTPGGGASWVSGSYQDPTGNIPCRITVEGDQARIGQDHRWRGLLRGTPVFDLQLGTAKPFTMTIESGASDDSGCDVGGVPLTGLEIKHGAGDLGVDFSAPNPAEMTRLRLAAGAADARLTNLGNANVAEISIDGGAATFTLDFGGALTRDCHAAINAGMATVDVRIPSTTAAKITAKTTLGNVDVGDGFTTRAGAYWTLAAIAGDTPVLTIDATVALGSLKLRLTE